MKKLLLLSLLVSLLMVSTFAGTVIAEEELTIAVSVPRVSNPFFGRAVQVLKDYSKTKNVNLIVLDARDNSSKQLDEIETMIIKDVDGFLLSPNDAEALIPGVKKLKENNIPTVTVDRYALWKKYLAHVGADNVIGARKAARVIAGELDGKGKVVQILGQPGSSPARDREKGFKQVMKNYSDVEVISQPGNFRRSKAAEVMESLLQAHSDIDAVFTHSSAMGLGVIEILKQRGYKPGEIFVVAFDTLPETLGAISEGWLAANVEQFPDLQFKRGMDILVNKIRKDKKPPQFANFIEPVIITKTNLIQSEKYGEEY